MKAPRKVFDRDGIVLWQGDARDVLPTVGKVDLLVTDPPYGVEATTTGTRVRQLAHKAIANDTANDRGLVIEVVALAWAAVRAPRDAYIFGPDRRAARRAPRRRHRDRGGMVHDGDRAARCAHEAAGDVWGARDMTAHDAYRATLDHAHDPARRFEALAWLAHEALERWPDRPRFGGERDGAKAPFSGRGVLNALSAAGAHAR